MLSIAINRTEPVCATVINKHNYVLMCNHKYVINIVLCLLNNTRQVQLGPRYEGQLNPMAEPIPHEVRSLVRTHVYHPYHAADRRAETDS